MKSPVKPAALATTSPVRGRPRNPATRAAMLRAARAMLEEVGPAGVTVEGVAARAGVGKPTVYRSWPNAQAVVMAALMETPPAPARSARGSAVTALRRQVRDIVAAFASRTGRSITLMLASAEGETELTKAFRHHFILARRDEGRRLLEAAIVNHEVRPDVDIETALDVLYGPIFFRLLVGHAALDDQFAHRLVDHVFRGVEAKGRHGDERRPGKGKKR
jgi:AcrR family transcriptional regulator